MTEEHQETPNSECPTSDAEQAEQADLSGHNQDIEPTVESVVEAVLFASDEPLTEARLANIVETGVKQIRQHIENLRYRANNNAFRIEQIAGGYQMLTLSPYNYWLKKLLQVRSDNKLSPAALETLAEPAAIAAGTIEIGAAREVIVVTEKADAGVRLAGTDAAAGALAMVVERTWLPIASTTRANAGSTTRTRAAIPIGQTAVPLQHSTLAELPRAARPTIAIGLTDRVCGRVRRFTSLA